MSHPRKCFLLGFLAAASPFIWADDLPAWMRNASGSQAPAYSADVHAVVLLNDIRNAVEDNGRVLTTTRRAIRILAREGRVEAFGSQTYFTGNGKIRDARAWVLSPTGTVFKIGPENIVDRTYATANSYDDLRVRELDGRSKVDPGGVFGYEIVSENNVPFAQFTSYFQGRLPVLDSIFALTLPQGWLPKTFFYNHEAVDPVLQGNTYTWEMQKLPFFPQEPSSPQLDSLVPRISVTCLPPTGAKPLPLQTFASWKDVSSWVTAISDPQAEPDDAVTAKSKALTANQTNEYRRIQNIGAYVQTVRYVSIQTGLERGNGYRPRAAAMTFSKEYGDCKDKATLMRALLKAAGISSYLVAISATDRSFVREDFPSPAPFNHAIVAISISADVKAPSVLDHPQLGRLLFFDPTNGVTSMGDLPPNEQGSLALIAAGDKGGLVRIPMLPASSNLVRRLVQAAIDETGKLTAHLHEDTFGQAAAGDRVNYYGMTRPDYLNFLQRWISQGASGAVTSRIEPRDSVLGGTLSLDVDFSAPAYAQRKGPTLLVFRPIVANRRGTVFLTNPVRVSPVLFNPYAWTEVARFKIPAGYKIDEAPDPVKLDTPFGHYTASSEIQNGDLVFTRSWVLEAASIPVSQYAAVREYFERILRAEQSPVVLSKQ
jgi:hypothetical protein